jgi:ABC-type phosphate transport system ATPase subunit
MDASANESEVGTQLDAEQQLQQLRRQLEVLYQNLRTVRHSINNDVAVIMAMAELSQRNPAQSQKLVQLCLEKAPQISASMGGFSELFNGALNLQQNPKK